VTKLSDALKAAQATAASRLGGDEAYRLVREVVMTQEAAGYAEDGVQVGENVPDFELPNAVGKLISLDEILNRGPAVIVFYRGGWCPFCTLHLKALQEARHEIEARGARLVAISLEKPDAERSAARMLAPDFELLHDSEGRVSRLFGLLYDVAPPHEKALRHYGVELRQAHGSGKAQLPLAATYVVGQDGIVTYSFLDVYPEKRAEPSDIVAALDLLQAGKPA
jgi:peroxiredoxin